MSTVNKNRWENQARNKKIFLGHNGLKARASSSESAKKRWEDARWYGCVTYYDVPKYCEKFNANFKERVRAYWGYKCVECGTPQNRRSLCVHHVHYDKKMCCNGSPRDVVPLCLPCHIKSNFNRDYWEDHFTEIIYSLDPIEGKCFFTKKEMKVFKLNKTII